MNKKTLKHVLNNNMQRHEIFKKVVYSSLAVQNLNTLMEAHLSNTISCAL
jgi:hypothetical protein